jgi:hypothetical protein
VCVGGGVSGWFDVASEGQCVSNRARSVVMSVLCLGMRTKWCWKKSSQYLCHQERGRGIDALLIRLLKGGCVVVTLRHMFPGCMPAACLLSVSPRLTGRTPVT